MNRHDFKNNTNMDGFTKTCLEDELNGKSTFRELWSKAESFEEFKDLVLNDDRVRFTQGVAELFKHDKRYINSIIKDKYFITCSDAGSVKIGNNDMNFLIPNGVGDGDTKVAILNKSEMNRSAFNFFTSVEGKFDIYNYDCGSEVGMTIEGRFGVYYKNGIVIFERWE